MQETKTENRASSRKSNTHDTAQKKKTFANMSLQKRKQKNKGLSLSVLAMPEAIPPGYSE